MMNNECFSRPFGAAYGSVLEFLEVANNSIINVQDQCNATGGEEHKFAIRDRGAFPSCLLSADCNPSAADCKTDPRNTQ